MKLYKVVMSLDLEKFRDKITEIEVKETDKCYVGQGFSISKDKLLKINIGFVNHHNYYNYFTYCLEEDLDLAMNLVYKKIIESAYSVQKEINLIIDLIKKDNDKNN